MIFKAFSMKYWGVLKLHILKNGINRKRKAFNRCFCRTNILTFNTCLYYLHFKNWNKSINHVSIETIRFLETDKFTFALWEQVSVTRKHSSDLSRSKKPTIPNAQPDCSTGFILEPHGIIKILYNLINLEWVLWLDDSFYPLTGSFVINAVKNMLGIANAYSELRHFIITFGTDMKNSIG